MHNQYDQNQLFYLTESKKLASSGQEYSHLVKLLSPEFYKRLVLYIQELPCDLANKTIFGKTHWKEQSASKQKQRN